MSDDFTFDGEPARGSGSPIDFNCAIIREARDTETQVISFREALAGIRAGRWAKQVEAVRAAYVHGGKDEAAKPKKLLAGILFSGTFERRASDALVVHSGLICADLDGLGDRVETWFEQITADSHTLACFRSPTGSGLKVVARIDPSRPHIESFHALEHYMLESFGLKIDEKCSDVSRICFVSHDPELFEADDAKVLPYPPPIPDKPRPAADVRALYTNGHALSPGDDFNLRGGAAVPDLLRAHGWTHLRGKYWCRPGKTGDVSASWEFYPNTLHIFSSSPETRFPPERKGFDPFAIYTHLECGGDFAAAARDLAKKGYGTQPVKSRQEQNLDRIAGQAPESKPVEPVKPEVLTGLAAHLDAHRVRFATPPPEPQTRLFLAGKPIATPGNLVTIIAKSKTGKTASLGAAVAAILGAHYDRTDLDTFKFTAPHTDEAVILFDTEQSPYDAWTCHKRTMERAGGVQEPEWLHHYALVGDSARTLRDLLPVALERGKTLHKGVFAMILDGVADFVASVNDEAECNDFVTYLRKLAVDFNCPIICVIHSNEGVKTGDDGRGHLGKQLTRKAESNLLLKKAGDVTTITSEKQRKAPITEADGVAFQWSDEQGRHVSVAKAPKEVKGGRPRLYTFDTFAAIFPRTADKALTKAQLLKYAQDIEDIKETAFRDILSNGVRDGVLVRTPRSHGFVYHLNVPI